MPEFQDLTRLVFLHSQYWKVVLWSTAAAWALYMAYTFSVLSLHKKFGGYKHSKQLAKKTGTTIDAPWRLTAKTALTAAIVLFIGLTLLGPKLKEENLVNVYRPAQIVLAKDITISMLAEDVEPSRLLAAKTTVYNILERLKNEGSKDKVGLIRFTDIAIPAVIVPSKDYGLVEHELRATTAEYIKIFESHGTNIWDAVTQGLLMFDCKVDEEKMLILISDGEQVAESDYIDRTRQEAINKRFENTCMQRVKIFIVGIGRSNEPALIPKERDQYGSITEYYTQTIGPDRGTLITTRPDLAYLEEVSNLVNGRFIHSENLAELNRNMDEILNQREIIGTNLDSRLKDVSPWFIEATLFLLFFLPIIKLG